MRKDAVPQRALVDKSGEVGAVKTKQVPEDRQAIAERAAQRKWAEPVAAAAQNADRGSGNLPSAQVPEVGSGEAERNAAPRARDRKSMDAG